MEEVGGRRGKIWDMTTAVLLKKGKPGIGQTNRGSKGHNDWIR